MAYRRAIHRACDRAFPAPKGTKGKSLSEWKKEHRWSPNRLRHTKATQVRDQFGLDADQVEEEFGAYRARFGIPEEK